MLTTTIALRSVDTKKTDGKKRKAAAAATKKPRKTRRVFDLSPLFLSQYFHLSQKDASKRIGVSVITVKRNCKRYNFEWPYRALKNRLRASRRGVALSSKGFEFLMLPLLCSLERCCAIYEGKEVGVMIKHLVENAPLGQESCSTTVSTSTDCDCETDTETVESETDMESVETETDLESGEEGEENDYSQLPGLLLLSKAALPAESDKAKTQ